MRNRLFGLSPTALIAWLSVIALGVVGVGYLANFTDAVTVTGTANTGTLSLVWSTTQREGSTPNCTVSPGVSNGTKAVTVTLTNTFPGQTCEMAGVISNTGTLNAKFNGFSAVGDTSNVSFTTLPDANCPAPGDVILAGGTHDCDLVMQILDGAQGSSYTTTLSLNFEASA